MNKEEIFNEIIETFENEDIKEFANTVIDNFDPYVFTIPASSTGKYHPHYSLGEAGLVRHTVAVVRFLNHMFDVESIGNQFTSRERDLLRVAAIAHDCKKSGDQTDYEKSKYTKFDHPLRAANFIKSFNLLDDNERSFVAHCIESHMGAWNTSKRDPGIVLPKPQDKYQILLHVCDYLASRKDIEMRFDISPEFKDTTTKPETPPDINTWIVPFGKHKGKTMREIYSEDPGYVHWAADKATNEPFHTFAVQIIENK